MNWFHLLIVDADRPCCGELLDVLSKKSYTTHSATDLSQAATALQTIRFDAMVLDAALLHADGGWMQAAIADNPDLSVFLVADEAADTVQLRRVHRVCEVFSRSEAPEVVVRKISTTLEQQDCSAPARQDTEVNGMSQQPTLAEATEQWYARQRSLWHELGNILAPVVGIASVLQRKLYDCEADGVQNLIETLGERAAHAKALVTGLRELTALESGAYSVALRTTDIAPLIESTIRSLSELAERSHVQVLSIIAVKPALVEVDFTLITNALTNVLRNAIEHVALEGDQEHRPVTVELAEHHDAYTVRVNNAGSVLSDQELEQFFEPFNTNRTRKPSGLGLGTTYTKFALLAQGGCTSVTSDQAQGTTVTMMLPKATGSLEY